MQDITADIPAGLTFTVTAVGGTATDAAKVMTVAELREFAASHLYAKYADNRTMKNRVPALVDEKIVQAWEGDIVLIAAMHYGRNFRVVANSAGW